MELFIYHHIFRVTCHIGKKGKLLVTQEEMPSLRKNVLFVRVLVFNIADFGIVILHKNRYLKKATNRRKTLQHYYN